MKETRICTECQSKMLESSRCEKGGILYVYLKCSKCGARRKVQISEKIIENYHPILRPSAKPIEPDPLPES